MNYNYTSALMDQLQFEERIKRMTGTNATLMVNRGTYNHPRWVLPHEAPFGRCPLCQYPLNQTHMDTNEGTALEFDIECLNCKFFSVEYRYGNSVERILWREWYFTGGHTTEEYDSVKLNRLEIGEFTRCYAPMIDELIMLRKSEMPWDIIADYLEDRSTNDYQREQIEILRNFAKNST